MMRLLGTRGFGRRQLSAMIVPAALLAPAPVNPAVALEFSASDIFFELNATDRDIGVHVALDADAWKELRINRPDGNRLIEVDPRGNLARIGLTELFFEGEEPSLVEVPFRRFLSRIPAGTYTFLGTTADNQPLRSTDRLTTDIPCPVTIVAPPTDDDVEIGELVIRWQPAPGVYDPDRQRCDRARDVGLVGYQLVVELVNDARDLERDLVVDLPPDATQFPVPRRFLEPGVRLPGTELKLEILAIEDSGNKTIVEQAFEVSLDD